LILFTSSPSIGNLFSLSFEKITVPSTSTSKTPPKLATPAKSASG